METRSNILSFLTIFQRCCSQIFTRGNCKIQKMRLISLISCSAKYLKSEFCNYLTIQITKFSRMKAHPIRLIGLFFILQYRTAPRRKRQMRHRLIQHASRWLSIGRNRASARGSGVPVCCRKRHIHRIIRWIDYRQTFIISPYVDAFRG